MPIPNTVNKVKYATDGSTNAIFPVPFPFVDDASLSVYYYTDISSTTGATLDSHYTVTKQVSNSDNPDSIPAEYGYIKWSGASPATGNILVIQRRESPIYASAITSALDVDLMRTIDRLVSSNQNALSFNSDGSNSFDAKDSNVRVLAGIHSSDAITREQVDAFSLQTLSAYPTTPNNGRWYGIDSSGDADWLSLTQLPSYSGSNNDYAVLKAAAWSDTPLLPEVPSGIGRACAYANIDGAVKQVLWVAPREVPYNVAGASGNVINTVGGADPFEWRETRETPTTGGATNKYLSQNPADDSLAWDSAWAYGTYSVGSIAQAQDNSFTSEATHKEFEFPSGANAKYDISHGLGSTPSVVLMCVESPKIDASVHPNHNKIPTFLIGNPEGELADGTNITFNLTLLNVETAYPDGNDKKGPIYWTGNHAVKIHWFARV